MSTSSNQEQVPIEKILEWMGELASPLTRENALTKLR